MLLNIVSDKLSELQYLIWLRLILTMKIHLRVMLSEFPNTAVISFNLVVFRGKVYTIVKFELVDIMYC